MTNIQTFLMTNNNNNYYYYTKTGKYNSFTCSFAFDEFEMTSLASMKQDLRNSCEIHYQNNYHVILFFYWL